MAPEPTVPPLRDLWRFGEPARKAWRFHVLDRISGVCTLGLDTLFRRLPVDAGPAFGAQVALVSRWINRKRVFSQRIAYNLETLSADRNVDEQGKADLVRRWWCNAGRMMGEYASVERYRDNDRVTLEGFEQLQQLGLGESQYIYVAVHLGSFELLGEFVNNGLKRTCVGIWEPERSRFKNRLLSRLRRRYGMYVFPPGQRSARHIHRTVVKGGADILCFVDEVRERQSHLPLFGRKPPDRGNGVNAIKLALKSGAPLIPIYMLREDGGRFRVRMHPPLPLDRDAPAEIAIRKALADIDAFFDPIVRAHADQWWMLAEARLPGFKPQFK